jgi:DNA-binding MarR family transcriptional regulator
MVERRPDPADRRARQVMVTAAGQDVLTAATERIRAVEDLVLAGLGSDDADLFRRLLAIAVVDAPRTDHSACDVPPC